MIHVLFVCLGNICRSPLAEGVFKKLVKERNLQDKIAVDSAGTSGWHIGDLPDPRTEEVAREHEILLDHRGRQFSQEDLKKFNYIIAMDISNYEHIRILYGPGKDHRKQLFLMRDFDNFGKGKDVPDPYYGGDDGFSKVYEMLLRSCLNFLDHIVDEHNIV
jgi:protein-tyrosine phosphatase